MKYLLLIALIFTFESMYSQKVDKYKLTAMSAIYKDRDGEYLYHRSWINCDYLAVIDIKNKRIKFYKNGQETIYDIIRTHPSFFDKDKNLIFKMDCLDSEGGNCGIRLITLSNPPPEYNGENQFIKVEHADITIVYRYKELE